MVSTAHARNSQALDVILPNVLGANLRFLRVSHTERTFMLILERSVALTRLLSLYWRYGWVFFFFFSECWSVCSSDADPLELPSVPPASWARVLRKSQ